MHDSLLVDFSKQNERINSLQIFPNEITSPEFEHALDGLVSEVGELADIKKKLKFMGRTDRNRHMVIDECGDCLFYLDRLLASVDSSISQAVAANIVKLKVRYGNNGELKFEQKKPDKDAEKAAQQLVFGLTESR